MISTEGREIDLVVIHCADTYADMDIGADEIRDWHVNERGWSDIGYHLVIRRDGTLEPGRDLDEDGNVFDEVGAHALGYNSRSIGICLVGGKPDFNFTRAQMRKLEAVVDIIRDSIPGVKISGHRDVSDKRCPGFDVESYFGDGHGSQIPRTP